MYDSSDSSEGDDILIYDSSEEVEDSDEEEDSENSDEEKTLTPNLDSKPKEVRNRLQIPSNFKMYYDLSEEEDDDFKMYDLSEEEEEEEEEDFGNSDEKKPPASDSDSSPKEVRNWLELPLELITLIFTKVGPIDILLRAQYVCTAWQKLSKQPQVYRSIDLRTHDYDERYIRYDPEKLAIFAVHRSAGQLVEFTVNGYATDAMLKSITKIRSPLKCLRLVECDIDEHDLMLMAKKLPLLEELEILHGFCCKSMIRGFGRYCPQLKSFRLTCRFEGFGEKSNGQAFSIARNMPGLHHLDLFGNPMTDRGLIAILDQCLHLKSLDCRQCFNLTFGEDLFKRCTDRNIEVKLPDDCLVGCGFHSSDCASRPDFYSLRDDFD